MEKPRERKRRERKLDPTVPAVMEFARAFEKATGLRVIHLTVGYCVPSEIPQRITEGRYNLGPIKAELERL